ncbi:hypothetical protein [Streptomyces decoyicus]|uniref:hypothetical protein n=1 Tax=Streptomyces decoyicus TaxID=249567 RepID=UPI003664E8FF
MAQQEMFEVWYRADSFPPDFYPTDRMKFSADDLAHALFVTGRAPADRWKHGATSVYEWLHRTTLIPAYIRRTPQGRLARSDLARELDRSEKVSLSYMLGQAMTGIFSEKVVSVRFLMHVDRYWGRHGMTFAPNTKKRADLFGQRLSGTWVVAEAKGRSGGVPPELRQALIAQKRAIRSVAGKQPEIAYGCVAHFPRETDGSEFLKVLAVDPPEDEPEAIDLHVDPDKFVQAYYEPFLAALEIGDEEPASGGYLFSGYGQFGLRVGVLRSIVERNKQAHDGRLSGLHDDVISILRQQLPEHPREGQFHDGTAINTKWHDALAQEDWSEYYYGDKPFWY